MGVEHELKNNFVRIGLMLTSNTHLVRRKEYCAVGALDALGAGRVVPRRDELTAAAPGAVVHNLKSEAVREPRGGVVTQEALAESLSLAPRDHAASSKQVNT